MRECEPISGKGGA